MGLMWLMKKVKKMEEQGGSGVSVTVTPKIDEGVNIADIKVGNILNHIYAPSGGASTTSEVVNCACGLYTQEYDLSSGSYEYVRLKDADGEDLTLYITCRSDGHIVDMQPINAWLNYTQPENPLYNIYLKSLDLAALAPAAGYSGINLDVSVTDNEGGNYIGSIHINAKMPVGSNEYEGMFNIPAQLAMSGKNIQMVTSNGKGSFYFMT